MPDLKDFDFRTSISQFSKAELVLGLFKECQPKILVVTDGLSFETTNSFGLTQFVSTLASSTIHGLTPKVIKASRGGALPGADIPNFHFDDATNGILKSRYDVVFIFGIAGEGANQLPQSEIDAIARFMQAGGGVFATGDHQSLGAAISRDIPRVRDMRFWRQTNTPDVANDHRISTNVSGSNEAEDFEDQSDFTPQSLYPNFRTVAGNPGGVGIPGLAHPLLQLPPTPTIAHPVVEVFPDHPHEGECHLPASLTTTFALDGATVAEWPVGASGSPVSPEVVARTMSHGTGFTSHGKSALEPRAFISICGYDGQRSGVGRVVTDSTWHHFVNINLDGTGGGPGQKGLQTGSPPVDGPALGRIRQYYRNIATWLMPANVRRCLQLPLILAELARYPLYEELVIPRPGPGPDPGPDPAPFLEIGQQVTASLATRLPAWEADALATDVLAAAIGDKAGQILVDTGGQIGRLGARDLGHAALGAATAAVVETLLGLSDVKQITPHKTFDKPIKDAAKLVVSRLAEGQRKELQRIDAFLSELAR